MVGVEGLGYCWGGWMGGTESMCCMTLVTAEGTQFLAKPINKLNRRRMAIWSMGSQTQILIGYLPVPAPLLCKYWTSTFFTVTCIWKKNKKTKRVREELGGGVLRTGMVEWICRGHPPPFPPFISSLLPPSSYPRDLHPTSASRTRLLCRSG